MIVGGVDVGSATGKAVVMKDGEIIGSDMIAATTRPQETARLVMEAAVSQAGLPSIDHLDNIIGTGYGRLKVPFAEENVSEKGTVINFAMNDRCAAGTGRFFEAMARVLYCGLEGISAPENQGEEPCVISNQCSVFAESEVVTLLNEGTDLPNIIAGINASVASRLNSMVRRVGLVEDLVLTGGCSKNDGLAKALAASSASRSRSCPRIPSSPVQWAQR